MNDLEISRRLALAIGWQRVDVSTGICYVYQPWWYVRKAFDYRDWAVAGPVAERFNAFPSRWNGGWVSRTWLEKSTDKINYCDIPQQAIALSVIHAKGVKL